MGVAAPEVLDTMSTPTELPSRSRQVILVCTVVVCAALVTFQVSRLPATWAAWNSGQPDLYPGQHRGMFFANVGGLALALSLPLLPAMNMVGSWSQRRRLALRVTWGVLMVISAASLVPQLDR